MKEEVIKLTLPLPISVNQAYAGYKIRHKSQKYKDWVQLASIELSKQTKYKLSGDSWLFVEYQFYMPCFYKNGKKKVIDVANYEKVLSDFLCDNIPGLEDHKFKRILLSKIDSDRNEVNIIIKEIG